ncbi:MAG: hypothetical protein DMD59_02755 [Gemmatimonadetes bacterium]|nr:MAG: hypothetical protein DMD59_02755 [Gemmatimonadota bacterium]
MTTLRMAIAVAVTLCAARSVAAQAPGGDSAVAVGLGATRQRLEARAENLEQLVQSTRVSLAGVLRSELQPYMTRRLGQNLRDPVVRARAYVRLSIEGAVVRPGFYGVPAEALLSDALMSAGGPTPEAELGKLHIDRAGRPIWQGKALQQAIAQGRTIDDAGLVAGDQYVMPHRGRTSTGDVLRFGGFLLSIPVTVYTLTRIF